MKYSSFPSAAESHKHSLKTLNLLYEYDDFMESIGRLVDLGCGKSARDLEWWATRTTRDDVPIPLEIQCIGTDQCAGIDIDYKNVSYQNLDIETYDSAKRGFDLLWCHDTFQYLLNPYQALKNWYNIANESAMFVLIVPQVTVMEYNTQAFDLPPGHFYNHTITSLIYMLAVNGWDCRDGFFKKDANDPWLHAIVYKSDTKPMNPLETSWYDLVDAKLLPESANESINKHGKLRQRDLLLPWLDKSYTWLGQQ